MHHADDALRRSAPERRTTPQRRVRMHLRRKLPEILIEAGSIVLAILLAFAVDEWRERRSQLALAERARRTIVAELTANRAELRGTREANARTLEAMTTQLASLAEGRATGVQTGMNLSQLSAAAFQAAQATQAAQFVDFDWFVRVGRTYELQRTYVAAQDSALAEVGATAAGAIAGGEPPQRVLQRIQSRLHTVQTLADGLLKAYDESVKGT